MSDLVRRMSEIWQLFLEIQAVNAFKSQLYFCIYAYISLDCRS